jgi:hypothetical protein
LAYLFWRSCMKLNRVSTDRSICGRQRSIMRSTLPIKSSSKSSRGGWFLGEALVVKRPPRGHSFVICHTSTTLTDQRAIYTLLRVLSRYQGECWARSRRLGCAAMSS